MGFNLETTLQIEEVTVNKQGDKIYISAEDSTLFDRYVKCFDFIVKESKVNSEELTKIENKYEGKEDIESQIEMAVEMSRVNVEFSDKAVKEIDGIFGEGTIRKYFREHYEKIPDFLPGTDCFIDFLENITPVMETIFDRVMKNREAASKARMAKYTPQDHKKPQKKGVSK
ncbi:MAG: hypothetical protein NC430_12265 [bacterium]|nr:hypothetical protein [bacterium]MCM1424831.1 hypothetical protein [bacterium]